MCDGLPGDGNLFGSESGYNGAGGSEGFGLTPKAHSRASICRLIDRFCAFRTLKKLMTAMGKISSEDDEGVQLSCADVQWWCALGLWVRFPTW